MKFRRPSQRARGELRLDITSLVDVVFLLIIFLLVTTTFKKQQYAFEIRLPKAGAQEVVVDVDVAAIVVARDGTFAFYDPRQGAQPSTYTDPADLAVAIAAYVEDHPDAPIRVRAEEDTPYQRVIEAVGQARQGGATNLQLEYERDEAAPGGDGP